MNVYMLEDTKTGKFYRRKHYSGSCWVDQKDASVWTNRRGTAAALKTRNRMRGCSPLVRVFKLEPNDV